MTVLWLDCTSGASGDMLLGALLDAGADEGYVRDCLEGLHLPGWRLVVSTAMRAGLRAVRAEVVVDLPEPARPYADVRAVIESADLPGPVGERALRALDALADAEARVHGASTRDVHLHEAGATDAVVDIVGVSAALESLHSARITASAIATGVGSVATRHGDLPLPAPAVVELLAGAILFGRGESELVTPTGAALLAASCESFGELPAMRVTRCGYGAGARDLAWPNVVRALVGEVSEAGYALVIEANLDDLNPELLPAAVDALLEAGAQDAWTTPIVMKKGRAAFTLTALAGENARDRVLDALFRETTTLGARITSVEKHELARRWIEVEVSGEPVRVKIGSRHGRVVTSSVEHDDALAAARATGRPLKDVYAEALAAARNALA